MNLENIKKFNRYSKVITTEDTTYKNIDSLLGKKGEFQEVVIVNFEKIRQYVDSKIG